MWGRASTVLAFSNTEMAVKCILTKILKVDPDLMHPAGVGAGQHYATLPVVAQPLKLGPTVLTLYNKRRFKY